MEKLTVCLFLITAFTFMQAWGYSGGTGEPDDPYQIATAADLIALGETPDDYDKHFIITADIDLNPELPGRKVFNRAVIAPDTDDTEKWFQGTPFTGTLDGSGHRLYNLTITGQSYLGLFGAVVGAVVRGLGLEELNINGKGNQIGGVSGYNWGQITASYSTGNVSGGWRVGGLAGLTEGGSIGESYSACNVDGDSRVGGLVGSNFEGSVFLSYSTGTVTGREYVGGLVGLNSLDGFTSFPPSRAPGYITHCYSTGAVTGSLGIGGLVGHNGSRITNCYSVGVVLGTEHVGGLVGESEIAEYIASSYWDRVRTSLLLKCKPPPPSLTPAGTS